MVKTLARATFVAMLAIAASACNKDDTSVASAGISGPEQTIQRSVALARESDVAGLVELLLPPAEFVRMKADWVTKVDATPADAAAKTRFAETMAKLTADDAVENIYKEIEPEIRQFDAQYQQQIPTLVAMGRGYMKGLVQQSQELSANEKEQASNIIEAIASWVEKTRFTDPDLVKKTLGVVTETARKLNLKRLDEARSLSFEASAPKLQMGFDGLKKVLDVYGFSINQALDSVTTQLVSSTGDDAVVKISYTLLGTPLESTTEMVRLDGHWYSKDTIDKLKARKAEQTPTTSEPAASQG